MIILSYIKCWFVQFVTSALLGRIRASCVPCTSSALPGSQQQLPAALGNCSGLARVCNGTFDLFLQTFYLHYLQQHQYQNNQDKQGDFNSNSCTILANGGAINRSVSAIINRREVHQQNFLQKPLEVQLRAKETVTINSSISVI